MPLRDTLARTLCESRHVWCSHDTDPSGCELLADIVLDLIREASEADEGR